MATKEIPYTGSVIEDVYAHTEEIRTWLKGQGLVETRGAGSPLSVENTVELQMGENEAKITLEIGIVASPVNALPYFNVKINNNSMFLGSQLGSASSTHSSRPSIKGQTSYLATDGETYLTIIFLAPSSVSSSASRYRAIAFIYAENLSDQGNHNAWYAVKNTENGNASTGTTYNSSIPLLSVASGNYSPETGVVCYPGVNTPIPPNSLKVGNYDVELRPIFGYFPTLSRIRGAYSIDSRSFGTGQVFKCVTEGGESRKLKSLGVWFDSANPYGVGSGYPILSSGANSTQSIAVRYE